MASSQLNPAGGDAILASKLNEVTMGSTAPTSPSEGWVWLDTGIGGAPVIKQYNGSAWVVAGGSDLAHFAFWGG